MSMSKEFNFSPFEKLKQNREQINCVVSTCKDFIAGTQKGFRDADLLLQYHENAKYFLDTHNFTIKNDRKMLEKWKLPRQEEMYLPILGNPSARVRIWWGTVLEDDRLVLEQSFMISPNGYEPEVQHEIVVDQNEDKRKIPINPGGFFITSIDEWV